MINVILEFLGLDLFNIKLSAKFYQTIPNGERVNFHFFQSLNSAKPRSIPNIIWLSQWLHLVNIPMCRQNCITIFHSVQEIKPFSLFQNLALGKASTDDKCHFAIVYFFQNLNLGKNSTNVKYGLHLVNINMYAKFHHKSPLSSVIFTFSEFGARHSLDRR